MQLTRRAFLSTLTLAAACVVLPTTASAKPEPTKNGGRHEKFNAEAQKGGYDVLFIGDSLTEGWDGGGENGGADVWAKKIAPLKAAKFGIGGEKTGNILWRVQNGNFAGAGNPKVVVLLAGTNDNRVSRRNRNPNPNEPVEGIRAIISAIQKRKPDAKILVLGILPLYKDPEAAWRKVNERTNKLLPALADGKRVFFKNINSTFINADGTLKGYGKKASDFYHGDEIHLRKPGYEAFADAVLPEVKRILALR
ncbi:MAG: GDSL-type esterase/lipase family protein [Puniceicoccales bacterium]|nr:GDSL-type esterase/lipase family protein [Puniceicoccales bacterium]